MSALTPASLRFVREMPVVAFYQCLSPVPLAKAPPKSCHGSVCCCLQLSSPDAPVFHLLLSSSPPAPSRPPQAQHLTTAASRRTGSQQCISRSSKSTLTPVDPASPPLTASRKQTARRSHPPAAASPTATRFATARRSHSPVPRSCPRPELACLPPLALRFLARPGRPPLFQSRLRPEEESLPDPQPRQRPVEGTFLSQMLHLPFR